MWAWQTHFYSLQLLCHVMPFSFLRTNQYKCTPRGSKHKIVIFFTKLKESNP